MNKTLSILISSSVLASGLGIPLRADAARPAPASVLCTSGTVTYSPNTYSACTGALSGNLNPADETAYLNSGSGVFAGITNWIYDRKINTPGVVENGTNILGFSITPTTGATSGTWGFSNTSYTGPIVLALKAGQGRSYYYFSSITGASSLLGTWNTNGVAQNQQGNPQGLSHASLFYVNQPVPEPFTILGVGTAVGFGTFFKKRLAKNKQA